MTTSISEWSLKIYGSSKNIISSSKVLLSLYSWIPIDSLKGSGLQLLILGRFMIILVMLKTKNYKKNNIFNRNKFYIKKWIHQMIK